MKPFDLKKALAGAPVQTTDGRKVSEIHFFRTAQALRQVIAVIEGHIKEYDIDGMLSNAISTECMAGALVMAPNKKEGWINLFRSLCEDHSVVALTGVRHGQVYSSFAEAETMLSIDMRQEAQSATRQLTGGRNVNIGPLRIEWEE